jgi:nicotinate-nucleotide adenylyltransferase
VRLGLLGGTFDPPHIGHLLVAVDAHERLGLDQLVFVPAARQPLKGALVRTPPGDRLAMVRAMVGDDPRFAVDPIEMERGGLSFSVDTLETYRRRPGVEELFFLVGADVLSSFSQWREPERVQALAELVILRRGPESIVLPSWIRARELESRRIDVSSTEIRQRVQNGRSVRGFVPDAVAAHIAAAGLYR